MEIKKKKKKKKKKKLVVTKALKPNKDASTENMRIEGVDDSIILLLLNS